MTYIAVKNLNFNYGVKRVLHDVSFTIRQGATVALVGPNGAGKTTLMRAMMGLEKPFSGKVTIDGLWVEDSPRLVHKRSAYLSDSFGLYDTLTVRQSLVYMAWCHDMSGAVISDRIDALTPFLGLSKILDSKTGTLSRGNRQRTGIAMALMHDPEIIMLDEPASGLDPEARVGLSKLILDLRKMGKTIIVSSHILNELEDYCTEMLVLRDGRVQQHVVLDTATTNAASYIRVGLTQDAAAWTQAVASITGVVSVEAKPPHDILIGHDGRPESQAAILRQLIEKNVPVCAFMPEEVRLVDAYMKTAEQAGA